MNAKSMLTRIAVIALLLLGAGAATATAADGPSAFVGEWALTIGKGGAGWLGVKDDNGKPTASLLWIAGSVEKVPEAKIEGDTLVLTLGRPNARNANANPETITVKVEGDTLKGERGRASGTANKQEFTGKRQPPVPPTPDLSKVKYGEPVQLFNGKDLTGWRIIEPGAANGWSVKDGALLSNPVQEPGKPHKNYGNLRTDREFEDFNLKLECNVAKNGNSGIYLRGIYEVQVADTFGHPLDPHNMGAVYSRIKPTESAEKPAGEWQTFDITLVDRHVTVILNGKKIIDNQPVLGCTGGALWSDPMRPGPIYLQGDHSVASFRNIVLKPVAK
jgi:hypothetical protein